MRLFHYKLAKAFVLSFITCLSISFHRSFAAPSESNLSITSSNELGRLEKIAKGKGGVGRPRRISRGRGTLGDSCKTATPEDLIAINPVETVNPYPVLWYYIPFSSTDIRELEVVLLNDNDDVVGEPKKILGEQLSDLPGFISVALPNNEESRLRPGMAYQFFVYCGDSETAQIRILNIPSEIQEAPAELQAQLEQAQSEFEKAQIYYNSGMWYDAFSIIGTLRREDPENSDYKREWEKLIEELDLKDITNQPIRNHIP
ncbi:MAG: DUF928 domain-containing protein [Okeania sp. SIO3H1]|nr:DUF928 domain-containing protein [Okeania sp. SIO3H1]